MDSAEGRFRSQPKTFAPLAMKIRAVAAPLPHMLGSPCWPIPVRRITLFLSEAWVVPWHSKGRLLGESIAVGGGIWYSGYGSDERYPTQGYKND